MSEKTRERTPHRDDNLMFYSSAQFNAYINKTAMKACIECGRELFANEFSRGKSKFSEGAEICKACVIAKKKVAK